MKTFLLHLFELNNVHFPRDVFTWREPVYRLNRSLKNVKKFIAKYDLNFCSKIIHKLGHFSFALVNVLADFPW